MRLIIHLEGDINKQFALMRVSNALPEYYRLKGKDDRRLTVRFERYNIMAIYHDKTDLVFFSQEGR